MLLAGGCAAVPQPTENKNNTADLARADRIMANPS
jgi:hypothetical protein